MRSFNLVVSTVLLAFPLHSQSIFYVSPQGNDRWSGTLVEPNSARTDGPVATLQRARDIVREAKKNGMPKGGITILVRGGTYRLAETLLLSSDDSGIEGSPIVWRASPGGQVTISGARTITGFTRVTQKSVLERIEPAGRGMIYQTNLKAQGVSEFGAIAQRGSPGLELFFNGERMTLARWPNSGWLHIVDIPQTGDSLYNEGLDRERRFDNVPIGRHYGRIKYDGDRPKRWRNPETAYLHGYWTWDWSDSFQRVQFINTAQQEITLAEPHHHYGYTRNQRYSVLNVLEELDTPGEWFLDRVSGDLYFWPPGPMENAIMAVSMLEGAMVVLDGASHVTIRGLTFEQSRGEGVKITGGTGNLLAGCTFRQLGGEAVGILGGSNNGMTSSDLYDLSLGAIRLIGGDRKTLTPGNNFAVNNHIHHYSKWLRTGQYGVFIDGVANRIAHNKLHDAPFEAMYLRGNEHMIEFNEIHNITQETGDAGAIHTGRDWTWRGNVIRYNYFHHLLGPGLHGVMAAYLDDWGSGFTIFGNVFYKAGRAAFIGGGRNNTVENNIFVDCAPSVHMDARGLGWAGYYFDGTHTWLFDRMDDMNFRQPPYSTRYPELLKLYEDEPRVPKGNKIVRNVSYGGRWMDVYDFGAFDFSVVTIKDNLIADPLILRRRAKGESGWDPYYLDIDRKEGYDLYKAGDPQMTKEFEGNVFLNGNPGFEDLAGENFQLRSDSPAYRLGFQRIPMDRIGLIHDEHRKELPMSAVKHPPQEPH
ncbi:MAG: right-handed parallel beta-helix repeat-containing protein [Bacteroidota bacterium]